MALYIPLTPLPGTPYWRPELWDPTGKSFRSFDFLPEMKTDAAIARLTWTLYLCFALWWPWARLRYVLRGYFSRNPRHRSIIRRHSIRGLRLTAVGIVKGLSRDGSTNGMRYPSWYDS